ncbi:MAG: hypothetical protein H6900_05435 [Rhodobacter sp.]|uniref:hypothetical protein n=1 Tax=Pararhodobacter sp. TaxID=2127056 RepID=UPI001DF82F9C|nr:hypothetical protein [Pararhodobacter sp.]MCB1346850.1 hypothetical protein [Paracoccaceae bacterium]MCC0072713.1 hypothetical protein [Rhodobacter sp.]HPD90958.1 hypothetical protein [Pararhodobacter sp.]
MKKTFALLAVTTALSAALAVPALADRMNATHGQPDNEMPAARANGDRDEGGFSLFRIFGRHHDDDDHGRGHRSHHDDDDDDDGYGRAGSNAAPAGTVPPPSNGLIGGGAPTVRVN